MPRFQFAYETLKRYRANRLLMAKKEMMVVEAKLSDLGAKLREATDSRSQLLTDQSQKFSSPGICQVFSDLIESQTVKIRRLESEILTVEQEFERHRNWVTHLGRELRIVEKLEEKKKELFDAEQLRFEKRKLDGWVAEHWKGGEQK